ncbi:hypothetical protein FRB99_003562 [Tulasnella sp. 403]|nr:hypothetical protein FRB99_003562 [Tulasnella sp. 403]
MQLFRTSTTPSTDSSQDIAPAPKRRSTSTDATKGVSRSLIGATLDSGGTVHLDPSRPVLFTVKYDVLNGIMPDGQRVALKRMRQRHLDQSNDPSQKYFEEEQAIWRMAKHAGILQLLDTATDSDGFRYLVSPWQRDGSVWDYVRQKPKCDRAKFILSGKEPFQDYLEVHQIKAILDGERPRIVPENLKSHDGVSYDYLWAVAQRCWIREPERRPAISMIYDWIKAKDMKEIAEKTNSYLILMKSPYSPSQSSSTRGLYY